MRIAPLALAASALILSGCAGGAFGRGRGPDEFAVARNAPLVVPPDFALTPPRPGEAEQGTTDPRAGSPGLFGGPQPSSAVETAAPDRHVERSRSAPLGRRRTADHRRQPLHSRQPCASCTGDGRKLGPVPH